MQGFSRDLGVRAYASCRCVSGYVWWADVNGRKKHGVATQTGS